ncbi:MAG: hypothetical protein L6367_05500 [Cellulomonas sp.]|nr:hypothetical protein [Cellulomonas sp.]
MATFSAVQAQHIREAIEEYDRRGRDDFLGVYGFGPSAEHLLVHEGRSYDSMAILGVAHRYATGRLASPAEFHDGMSGVVALLRRRGFEVTEPAVATPVQRTAPVARAARRPAASRAAGTRTAAPRRAVAASDRPVTTCPTCFMALPATGVCDQCG